MIFIYFGGSIVFTILVFSWIAKRREDHKANYPIAYKNFMDALAQENIGEIRVTADQLIWNEFFTVEHRKFVFEELDKRVEQNPTLKKVWSDAHFKYHGLEPVEDVSEF